jgi:hypothetical protein
MHFAIRVREHGVLLVWVDVSDRADRPMYVSTFLQYEGKKVLRAKFKILNAKYRKPFGIGHTFI